MAVTEARTMQSTPQEDEDPTVISLRGATASLGSRPVLRGVDLTVRRGRSSPCSAPTAPASPRPSAPSSARSP